MAIKRRGESWHKTIGKFPDNKIDKSQIEQLNERYRHWFLLLEDESILPHDLDRRAQIAHEQVSESLVRGIESKGHMSKMTRHL